MSKKKNTLQDLDAFLKQQAATLVDPKKLKTTSLEKAASDVKSSEAVEHLGSEESIFNSLTALSKKDQSGFRKKLYDLIIKTVEAQDTVLPEDKMLINTALYLKSGDQWKHVVRDYWHKKKQ